jgi:protein arginine kinase activator
MTCDNCHQRPAKFHVTRIVNGQRSEEDLCEECALQRGELPFALQPMAALQQFLAGMLQGQGAPLLEQAPQARCPSCGLTYAEFGRTGMLGCADCYRAFGEALRPLLRRIQGAGQHSGKLPRRAGGELSRQRELRDLREQLQAAVQQEDFERAAVLRDRIRELERSGPATREGGDGRGTEPGR